MPKGTVEKVEGELATVSIERQDMCGECHACEVLGEVKKCQIQCIDKCQSQVGDEVEIDLDQASFLKATGIMYGVPLVGLFIGLGVGMLIPARFGKNVQEIGMMILGLLMMSLGLFWVKGREKKHKYNKHLPSIIKNQKV